MEKQEINEKNTIQELRKRVDAIMKEHPGTPRTLAKDHVLLQNDFEHVKELNMVIADKYEFVISKLPMVQELDYLLANLDKCVPTLEKQAERRDRLNSLKIVLKAMQAYDQSVNIDQQKLTGVDDATRS